MSFYDHHLSHLGQHLTGLKFVDIQSTRKCSRVELDRVDNKIHVNTSGGDINLNNVKAAVSGNTSGGDVMVTLTTTDFSQDHSVDLRTSGGAIKLTIPEKLPATINAQIRTSRRNYERKRYDIYSDFPLKKSEPDKYGEVVIKSEGDINGGGDMIRLETSGGDIHIKKGK